MIRISFSDPGYHPRTTEAETLEGALDRVKAETNYTEAFLVDTSARRPVARATREVGETKWSVKLIPAKPVVA